MFEVGDYVKLLPYYSDDNTYKIISIYSQSADKKSNITVENILTNNTMYCSEECMMIEQKCYRKQKINKICSKLGIR